MKKIRTIVIDDEPHSRNELIHLLRQHPMMEVIGEAGSSVKGLEKILKFEPDVIFLDIEMTGMTGVELAESLKKLKKPPFIVFATAYPDYAAKAFRLQAVDYLLKPFAEEQLQETVGRLQKLLRSDLSQDSNQRSSIARLAVQDEDKIIYIHPKDILYIFREQRETHICTLTEQFTSKLPLKDFERKLSDYSFFRIHKSYLVQLSAIAELIPWGNGTYEVKLQGLDTLLPVSRNYVKKLRERLEL